jgi:putative FmdB family regulatory protein
MPVYEYQCQNCGKHFEIKQSFTDDPLTVCPNCAGKIHRVIQAAGIVFKGSGFYVNDSRSKQTLATVGDKKTADKTTESAETNGNGAAAKADGASTAESAPKSEPAAKSETAAKPQVATKSATD